MERWGFGTGKMRETECNQCPIQLLERLRPKRSYAAGFTAPFGFGSIEPRRDAQGNPPNSWRGCANDAAQGKLRTNSVQVPNAKMD